ncbi:MAG: glycosyltransferase family 2 protein [Lachnospiraceae bacterium]|nr:glycosyltransferase family 2 protein [Lachnospiraceae bacterium]
MKINLVMIVKNEERSLKKCLETAADLVDKMIVIDTGSSDRTKSIAENMGAKVFDFVWTDDFSAARNFALDQSDGDWNLVLDGDEYLRSADRKGLEQMLLARQGMWLGCITRYDAFRDEEGVSVSTAVLPRLLPKGVRYEGRIHEQPKGDYPSYGIGLEADHDGYLYEDKGERNLPFLERAVKEHPEDGYYVFQLAYTLRNLKRQEESLPYFREFYRLSGKNDGYWAGGVVLYLYTLLDLAFAEYLDEAARIIEKEDAVLGGWSDFCFVCGLFYMKRVLSDVKRYLSLLPNIEKCYLKCLSLGEQPMAGGVVGTGSFRAAYNLGAWYEVSGQMEQAGRFYRMAAEKGYGPALKRIEEIWGHL